MNVWEVGRSIGNRVAEGVGRVASRVQEGRPLGADLLESEDAYLVVFDAPGVEKRDVQVRFAGGDVLVRMDRFREFYEDFEMRFPGRGLSLDGRVRLPDDAVDAAAATATLKKNGTLQVHVPKRDVDEDVTTVEIEETAAETDADVGVDTGEFDDSVDTDEFDDGIADDEGSDVDPDEPVGNA
jgi:HSP20 family protein